MENPTITLISTVLMVITGMVTLALQFRKDRNDAASQVTASALSVVEPLRVHNAELRDEVRKLRQYVDYLQDGVQQLGQCIMNQGRKPPWLMVDFEDFVETIDL